VKRKAEADAPGSSVRFMNAAAFECAQSAAKMNGVGSGARLLLLREARCCRRMQVGVRSALYRRSVMPDGVAIPRTGSGELCLLLRWEQEKRKSERRGVQDV